MADRLLVGVLGNRNAGKSRTWNSLFGKTEKSEGVQSFIANIEAFEVLSLDTTASPEGGEKYGERRGRPRSSNFYRSRCRRGLVR
jgi:hypothetical protein